MRSRSRLGSLLAIGLAAGLLAGCSSDATDDAAPSAPTVEADDAVEAADSGAVAFYTESAETGTAIGGVLTLSGVDPAVVLVEDRPAREVQTLATEDFARSWDDLFDDDPPNAVLQFDVDGDDARHQAVVELTSMKHSPGAETTTHGYTVLQGEVPARFDRPSLVIDDAAPVGGLSLRNGTNETITATMWWGRVEFSRARPVVWASVTLEPYEIRAIPPLGDPYAVGLTRNWIMDPDDWPEKGTSVSLGSSWRGTRTGEDVSFEEGGSTPSPNTIKVRNDAFGNGYALLWYQGRPAAVSEVLDMGDVNTWSQFATPTIAITSSEMPAGMNAYEVPSAGQPVDADLPKEWWAHGGRIDILSKDPTTGSYRYSFTPGGSS